MPTVLAQSNLPKSAAVVVSSETIILRDPNNRILEKYTSDEQKQLSLKSYGIKPATMLSPGENKTTPDTRNIIFYHWLQNNNPAYINTLVKPRFNYKYEFAVNADRAHRPILFGASDHDAGSSGTYKSFRATLNVDAELNIELRVVMSDTGDTTTSVPNISHNYDKITIENGKIYVNDEEKATISSYNPNTALDSYLFLFSFSNNNQPASQGTIRLAYFKIFDENNHLLRDFVPASIDGIFGMYDNVSHYLFINANENGSFEGGDDETVIPESGTFGFGNVNTPDVIDNDNELM